MAVGGAGSVIVLAGRPEGAEAYLGLHEDQLFVQPAEGAEVLHNGVRRWRTPPGCAVATCINFGAARLRVTAAQRAAYHRSRRRQQRQHHRAADHRAELPAARRQRRRCGAHRCDSHFAPPSRSRQTRSIALDFKRDRAWLGRAGGGGGAVVHFHRDFGECENRSRRSAASRSMARCLAFVSAIACCCGRAII